MIASRSNLESMDAFYDKASCPEDVFGELAGTPGEQMATLKMRWRSISRSCHPDLAAASDKALATTVFQALGVWEEQARRKVEAGTYGDRRPAPDATPAYTPTEFEGRGKRVRLTGLLGEGTVASVHAAEWESDGRPGDLIGGGDLETFVKFARDPQDNESDAKKHGD